ncbi:MAG: ribosomal protein S18-alanine N-acetyltransferase [Ilumatobacteraceae bacterium]
MSLRERRNRNELLTVEPMRRRHLRRVLEIEELVYPRPWTHRTFASELGHVRAGTRNYLVAYVGDVLVGYAGMMFVGSDAHITNVAVDPAWQGRGVATELMLDVAYAAREHGCAAMTLEVRHTNAAAQQLYRRFGFAPVGVRKKYYENTDDAIVMWCNDVDSDAFATRLREIEGTRP